MSILTPERMKSTKVQNPRRILLHALRASSLVNYANARARKLATPRVVGNAWCCQFSLQQGLATWFWARLNVVDNHWASWVFPCGSASITVNTIRMRITFAMKKNGHLNVWNTTATPLDLSNGASSEKTPQIF